MKALAFNCFLKTSHLLTSILAIAELVLVGEWETGNRPKGAEENTQKKNNLLGMT